VALSFSRKSLGGLSHRVRPVEGNVSWVTTDGCFGYDIVDCANEAECRRKYADLEKNGLRILECTEVAETCQFLNWWKRQHQKAA
jgi:hypothetical protein